MSAPDPALVQQVLGDSHIVSQLLPFLSNEAVRLVQLRSVCRAWRAALELPAAWRQLQQLRVSCNPHTDEQPLLTLPTGSLQHVLDLWLFIDNDDGYAINRPPFPRAKSKQHNPHATLARVVACLHAAAPHLQQWTVYVTVGSRIVSPDVATITAMSQWRQLQSIDLHHWTVDDPSAQQAVRTWLLGQQQLTRLMLRIEDSASALLLSELHFPQLQRLLLATTPEECDAAVVQFIKQQPALQLLQVEHPSDALRDAMLEDPQIACKLVNLMVDLDDMELSCGQMVRQLQGMPQLRLFHAVSGRHNKQQWWQAQHIEQLAASCLQLTRLRFAMHPNCSIDELAATLATCQHLVELQLSLGACKNSKQLMKDARLKYQQACKQRDHHKPAEVLAPYEPFVHDNFEALI